MTIILIIAIIWGASALIHSAREKRAKENAQRIASEQARIKREMREMKQRANEEVAARIALEREQMRQAREQEKLAKEQEKQAAQLAKHEKRLADLEYRVSQAESDIEFLNDRIAQLDAQRDYLLLQQSGTIPGGKEHTKYQAKIISIDNQIHTAENKLNKAQHIKAMAQREMEVA